MDFVRGNDGVKVIAFDGTKLTLNGIGRHSRPNELNIFDKSPVSIIIPFYTGLSDPVCVFVTVKDQKNIVAFDDHLRKIEDLSLDVSMSIVSMCHSQKDMTLFVSGNVGWIKAFKLRIETGALGLRMSWVPVWTNHDSSQWMSNLICDEESGTIFASSGIEVFQWDWKAGQRVIHFETNHTMEITDLKYSSRRLSLFTASGDGTVKAWKIFKGIQNDVGGIKNKKCGPTLMALNDNYIFVISAEKVLRQYDLSNLKLVGEYDFEPGVGIESKSIESPMKLRMCDEENALFVAIDARVHLLRMNSLPTEIFSCCNHVSRLFIDDMMRIYALCSNNYIHVLSQQGRELGNVDLYSYDVPMNVACGCVYQDKLYLGSSGSVFSIGVTHKEKSRFDVGSDAVALDLFSCEAINHMCHAPILGVCCQEGVSLFCDKCFRFIARLSTNTRALSFKFTGGVVFVLQAQRLSAWSLNESGAKQQASVALRDDARGTALAIIDQSIFIAMDDGTISSYSVDGLAELNTFRVCNSCISYIHWYNQPGFDECLCCMTKDGILFQVGISNGAVLAEKPILSHTDFRCLFSAFNDRPFLFLSTGNSVRSMEIPTVSIEQELSDLSSSTESIDLSDPEPEDDPKPVITPVLSDPIPKIEPEVVEEPPVIEERPRLFSSLGSRKTKAAVPVVEPQKERVDLVFVDGKLRLMFGNSPKTKQESIKTLQPRVVDPPPAPEEPPKQTRMPEELSKTAPIQTDFVEQSVNYHTTSRKTPVSGQRKGAVKSSRSQLTESDFYDTVASPSPHYLDRVRPKPRPSTRNRGRTLPLLKNRNDDILQVFKLTTPEKKQIDGRKTPIIDTRTPKIIRKPRLEPPKKTFQERKVETPKRVTLVTPTVEASTDSAKPIQIEERPKTQDTHFSKKNFVAKLDVIPHELSTTGGLAFTNGKILPTLKPNSDPNLEVLASVLHPDHVVDFFNEDSAHDTDLSQYSTSIELFYDILDGSSEASRTLLRSSPQARTKVALFSSPLHSFLATAPHQTTAEPRPHPTKTKPYIPHSSFPTLPRPRLTLEREPHPIPELPM